MSPVIGVILMVAITVVMATVIGTVVLDTGQRTGEAAPTASLAVDADPATDTVTIRHRGGDPLDPGRTQLRIRKENASSTESATLDAAGADRTLRVGMAARVTMGTATDGVHWPVGGPLASPGAGDAFADLASGDVVTVTVIDTGSQRVVYETSVAA